MVTDLFDEGQSWNIPLIQFLFSQQEYELILALPSHQFGGYDMWTWHFSKDGLYSVKSAYHMSAANHAPAYYLSAVNHAPLHSHAPACGR